MPISSKVISYELNPTKTAAEFKRAWGAALSNENIDAWMHTKKSENDIEI